MNKVENVANSSVRHDSGSRIFNTTGLEFSYFDAAGNPHYMHADYQGSIIAVTDSAGTVVQTTNYYPYGEPWREPTGQPMLFGGKERTSLADYHFDPRNYNPAGIFWHAPDRKASDFTRISPYSYCGGNPIGYIDPTGNVLQAIGTMFMGAVIGGGIDYYAQIGAYMWISELSYDDAKKHVDKTSVATAAISGALGGVLGSVFRIPSLVNKARTIKSTISVAEGVLAVGDAVVDYSESDGLSLVGFDPDSKSIAEAGLDLIGGIASFKFTEGAIKFARRQALENVSAPGFKTYTEAEKASHIGVKSFVDGQAFEVTSRFHNEYLTKSFIEYLNKKLEEK